MTQTKFPVSDNVITLPRDGVPRTRRSPTTVAGVALGLIAASGALLLTAASSCR